MCKDRTKIFYISLCILTLFCIAFTSVNAYHSVRSAIPRPTFTVVIDAGHGGIDGGVVGVNGQQEAELNLKYAFLLGERLEKMQLKVVYTRTNADGLYGEATSGFKRRDMYRRKEIIINSNADMVISVHMNHCPYPSRQGPQVFFQQGDEVSKRLSAAIQNSLNAFTGNSHTCLAGDFFVLQCLISKPCVIVEYGFLSNADEALLLASTQYAQRITDAVAEGIMLYLYSV